MDDIDEKIYTTTVEVIQEKTAKIEVDMAKVIRNLSNSQQRDSNGGSSREQTEGRLLQSKIVGIDGRCGENLFSDTIAQQTRKFA